MKRAIVPQSVKDQVIKLRETKLTYREIAEQLGLKTSTVAGIVTRNKKATTSKPTTKKTKKCPVLEFVIPEPIISDTSAVDIIQIERVEPLPVINQYNDGEINEIVWLKSVIDTGDRGLIHKAVEAAKTRDYDIKAINSRMADILQQKDPRSLVFLFDWADIKKYAKEKLHGLDVIDDIANRWGSVGAFMNCPQIKYANALEDNAYDGYLDYEQRKAAMLEEIKKSPYQPKTLTQCIDEIDYWYSVMEYSRSVVPDSDEREYFTRGMWDKVQYLISLLATIKPKNKKESRSVWAKIKVCKELEDMPRDYTDDYFKIIDNLFA